MQTDMGKEDFSLNQQRAATYQEEIDNTGRLGPVFVSSFLVSYYFSGS